MGKYFGCSTIVLSDRCKPFSELAHFFDTFTALCITYWSWLFIYLQYDQLLRIQAHCCEANYAKDFDQNSH
jgi:hypothetical protein